LITNIFRVVEEISLLYYCKTQGDGSYEKKYILVPAPQ